MGGAAAVAVGAADIFWLEPRWPAVNTHRVPVFGGKLPKPIRLLQLSDLHLSRDVSAAMIEHAFRLAIEQKPDLVCLTGDYVTAVHGQSLSGYADLFRLLSSRFPTFGVKGNHDGGAWAEYYMNEPNDGQVDRVLADGRVTSMQNRSERLQFHGTEFWLAGVGDLWSEEVRGGNAFEAVPPSAPAVLLAHNPDSKDHIGNYDWRLMLSGHTHGAQNSLPYLSTRFAPVEDKRFVAGLNYWPEGKRWIHTNVGVGNLRGFRILRRPEVTVLELV